MTLEGPGRPTHRISESLDSYLTRQGFETASSVGLLTSAWREIVGDELADRSWPEAIRGNDLVVAVDHPAWATELKFHSEQILHAVSARLGKHTVSALKLHVRASDGLK